jgi:GNAT superfamily N-acetyltransferase
MENAAEGEIKLKEYVNALTNAGHKKIIAPIDGDTWHKYRLVSFTNGEPSFPLEPQNPLWYNDVYEKCGFSPLKKYQSVKFEINNVIMPEKDGGITIRNFREGDLKLIYDISRRGFDENFLYGQISYEEFKKLYIPALSFADFDLVCVAEIEGIAAGFIFSFVSQNRLILKTMAVLPEYRQNGIGTALIGHVLAIALSKGITAAIGALIAEGNNSYKIVSKYGGEIIREYTVYGLEV